MATQQGMSGIDIMGMISELTPRLPLWIGKIYQYDPKTFGVRLNGEEKARYHLIIEAGRRAHLVGELPPAPPNPSGFSMFLRKYLTGGRVLGIRQHGLQRIFEIEIGKRETSYHLVLELFDEGNAVLCDHDYLIIKPLWHHRFRDREVVPGVHYLYPGRDTREVSPDELQAMLQESGRDLVRTLAVSLMLGGKYAEEVCRIAGLGKELPAADADPRLVGEAYSELLRRVREEPHPVITASGCWPVAFENELPLSEFTSFQEALEAFYPSTRREAMEKKPTLTKEERIRAQQEAAVAKFEKKIVQLERAVETIYTHYTLVNDVIETLSKASNEKSWQEIQHILRDTDHPVAKAVVAIHPAEAAVDLVLDVPVKIYVHESLEANAGRYYELIKKFKRKRSGALKALERPVEKKVRKKREFVPLKPRWYHRFRWCYTSDGILLLGGRDASQNEELVKRYMEGGDIFMHADVHGGSVVIVKGFTERMDEAARFTASYSNAWKAGHFSADVYAARPDQVSKTPESGEYVARGAFIVRGERQYFRDVPLGIAIGIRLEPSAAVIGGPIEAISERTDRYVVLGPGKFQPNDIAKKVLRSLRDTLSEDEWKELKNVLNTEKVAAFVPPGGSDIVE